MRNIDIAIIGAGIAGLTCARALQLRGFRVRVFEQSVELREVGAGLTISPNATHVLNAIGLEQVLERIGMRPERGGVKHWRTGETVVDIPRGADMMSKYGAAYYQVHRADLHDALASAVRTHDDRAIVLGHSFQAVRQTERTVEVGFTNGATVQAAAAIGADGLRSAVRTALFGAGQPSFTGYVAYRGLVSTSKLPPGILNPTSCISIGPGHTFARYLIRNGALVNYVGLVERSDWRIESWSQRAEVAEVLAEFDGWYDDLRTIIRGTPRDVCYKWALFDREPLPSWRKGHIALLGDAAHPMLPFLGQGAAMGIEDAMVLARAFELADTIEDALRRYEEARLPRTTEVMQKSRDTARTYHTVDPDTFRTRGGYVSAESLGLMSYNAAAVPL